MTKTKTRKEIKGKSKTVSGDILSTFDLDVFVDKYIWILLPILVILYYWFSAGSTGFYQDDEIGHYRNIRQFWGDPFSIMGNQPKPGWKILLVLPGLLGFAGVMLTHSAIAALTVISAYKLGRALKIKNSSFIAFLLASQPLFLQLSFRSYSEITAGLFVVLMILFYYKEQYVLAAITSSYIFSIRQEFALVSIGLGVIFIVKKNYIPFVLLGWTPVALALIGWFATGNIMWLIDDMTKVGVGFNVPHKSFWHYFETYIYIVGPVTLSLFLIGYWSFLHPFKRIKENLNAEGFLFFTFTIMWAWAVFSAWEYEGFFQSFGLSLTNKSPNPGHWRYVISIAPLTAVYAGKGLNRLFDKKTRAFATSVLAIFALVTMIFLSRESNGLILLDTPYYGNLLIILLVLVISAAFSFARFINAPVMITLLTIVAVAYTLYTEKPRKLDTEAETVKQAAQWYIAEPSAIQQKPLYGNHVLFRYFADIDINDKERDMPMQKTTLKKAPIGSIVVWDSHYGNSQFGGDVPMDFFKENPQYSLLNQFISSDQRFGILIFEKVQ